jgi:hypothetical protein
VPEDTFRSTSKTHRRHATKKSINEEAKKVKIRLALGFTNDEKINEDPKGTIPLTISQSIHGHLVGGCLIDEGNHVDI